MDMVAVMADSIGEEADVANADAARSAIATADPVTGQAPDVDCNSLTSATTYTGRTRNGGPRTTTAPARTSAGSSMAAIPAVFSGHTSSRTRRSSRSLQQTDLLDSMFQWSGE